MWPSSVSWVTIRRLGVIVLVVLVPLFVSLAVLPSPLPVAAQPRPTLTSPGAPPEPAEPPSLGPPSSACDSICGQVVNLESNSGEPEQAVHFTGPGDTWFLGVPTNRAGKYSFGRLGTDVGLLNLYVAEGSDIHPVTTDIALAPPPGQGIVVNLGFYRSVWTAPPLAPTAWAEPAWVEPGGRVTFVVQVRNRLSTRISGVAVTDYLPEGLTLMEVTADRGSPQRAGNYGAVFVGELGPDESATVRLVADVAPNAFGSIRNRVTLIYRQHAATQAVATVTVGEPPTATAAPTADATARRTAIPQTLPATGPTFLPVTGYGLTAIGIGLGLGITALAARLARRRRHRDSPPEEEASP